MFRCRKPKARTEIAERSDDQPRSGHEDTLAGSDAVLAKHCAAL
jgi:hypothetical protein